jgi:hypothetical protein
MKTFCRNLDCAFSSFFSQKERSEEEFREIALKTYQRNCSERKCAFSFHCKREEKILDLNDIKLYRVCTKKRGLYVTQGFFFV